MNREIEQSAKEFLKDTDVHYIGVQCNNGLFIPLTKLLSDFYKRMNRKKQEDIKICRNCCHLSIDALPEHVLRCCAASDYTPIREGLKEIHEESYKSNSEKNLEIRKLKKVIQALKADWINYSWEDKSTHPQKYGKYFICRKDGKIHWETWNGSGWAYNHKEIVGWIDIPSTERLLNDN